MSGTPPKVDEVQLLRSMWLADLRNGKYEQCFGRYREGNARCVGGVLMELVAKLDAMTKYYEVIGEAPIISWNDQERLTFFEIADKLEKYFNILRRDAQA